MSPLLRWTGSLLLLPLFLAGHARADEPPLEAQALLRRGVDLRRDHANAEALEAFRRSYALQPTGVARAQIALAEQALGRWIEADADLEAALARTDDTWVETNRVLLAEARDAIGQHVAFIVVDVDVATATVRLGSTWLTPGAEHRVLTGQATLETSAPGYVTDTRPITLAARAHVKLSIALVPSTTAPDPAPAPERPAARPELPPRSETSHPTPWGAVALLGVAAVSAGIGTYFGVLTFQKKADRDAECTPQCTPAAQTSFQQATSAAAVSDVAFGTAFALVGAGATWWYLDQRSVSIGPGPAVAGATLRATW